MQSKQELPQGYAEILHIDLQKDKKAALRVNGLVPQGISMSAAGCIDCRRIFLSAIPVFP